MGCCFSRDSSANNPTPNPAPDRGSTSRQALAASSPAQPSSIASRNQTRPNQRLKPLDPTQRSTLPNRENNNGGSNESDDGGSRTPMFTLLTDSTTQEWTRDRLERERRDWWETRVTEQEEIWGAIRLMVQHLQDGEVEQAQALMDATECTCPTGEIARGVFDERGELYRVPEWIVIEPAGLIEDNEVPNSDSIQTPETEHGMPKSDDENNNKDLEVDIISTPYSVRCRLSSNQRDVLVSMHKGELVASLTRKLRAEAGIPTTTRIRIVYGGKIYESNQALESNPQWRKEHVLNAMMFEGQGE